jgi:hypothetical protein
MKKTITLAVAAFATLAFASSAFASFAPKLVVSSLDVGGPTRIGVVTSNADDPTAKVTIYVPTGFGVATPAPNTKLGDVTATAAAADLGGAVLPLTGELDAIAATATTTAAAQQCGVTPTQTWDLHLTAAGQTLDIPMFVVTTVGSEAAMGPAKLVVCLPPPDVPAGTPGRATFGAKLLSATFSSTAIAEPTTTGDYRWTSLWTPYNPGKGTPNAAGSVETQSLRHLPIILHFATSKKRVVTYTKVKGKRVKHVATVLRWKANVTENGKAPGSATIGVFYKNKRIGGAAGKLTLRGVASAKLTLIAIVDSETGGTTTSIPTGQTATIDDLFYHDLGQTACTPSAIFGGLPCIDATLGGEIIGGTTTIKAYTK